LLRFIEKFRNTIGRIKKREKIVLVENDWNTPLVYIDLIEEKNIEVKNVENRNIENEG
jgi:hypothetical protein